MSSQARSLLPDWCAGYTRMELAFRRKRLSDQRFQKQNEWRTHASSRTSNSPCGSRSRLFKSGMLPAAWLCGCGWTGRAKHTLAVPTSVATRGVGGTVAHRFRTVIHWAQPVPQTQPSECRDLLDCYRCRRVANPLSSDCCKHSRRVKHGNAQSQKRIVGCSDSSDLAQRMVSLWPIGWQFDLSERGQFCPVHRAI